MKIAYLSMLLLFGLGASYFVDLQQEAIDTRAKIAQLKHKLYV